MTHGLKMKGMRVRQLKQHRPGNRSHYRSFSTQEGAVEGRWGVDTNQIEHVPGGADLSELGALAHKKNTRSRRVTVKLRAMCEVHRTHLPTLLNPQITKTFSGE